MIAVDAGNTLIKVVVFHDSGSVDGLKTWPAAAYEDCLNWLKQQSDSIWIADSSARTWPIGQQVSAASNWGFDLEYSAQIGLDRLASSSTTRSLTEWRRCPCRPERASATWSPRPRPVGGAR